MKSLFLAIWIAAGAGCSQTAAPVHQGDPRLTAPTPDSARSVQSDGPVQLPVVPADAKPQNGSVAEYWPNGNPRAELSYKSGRLEAAVYYASNGQVVYEMAEDSPGVAATDGKLPVTVDGLSR